MYSATSLFFSIWLLEFFSFLTNFVIAINEFKVFTFLFTILESLKILSSLVANSFFILVVYSLANNPSITCTPFGLSKVTLPFEDLLYVLKLILL